MIDFTVRAELYCWFADEPALPGRGSHKHWRCDPLVLVRTTLAEVEAVIAEQGWAIAEDEAIAICADCFAAGRTHAQARATRTARGAAFGATVEAVQAGKPRCEHGKAPAPKVARDAVSAGHATRSNLLPNLVCWECES